jgi:hypothetical protein
MEIAFFDRVYRLRSAHLADDMMDQDGNRPTALVAELIRSWLSSPLPLMMING